ncbi:MAG: FMN-binding protein [Fibrobacterales bacterium]
MKAYRIYIILAIIVLLAPVIAGAQDLKQSAERELRSLYGIETLLHYEKVLVTKEMRRAAVIKVNQNYYFNFLYYWSIHKGDSLIGHAFVDNVFGKQMPITFLVVFDAEQKVVYNTVLKYREIRGRAVKQQEWLDLFKGKNARASFKYGTDIDALSGSTISAKSMTKGIQKLCFLVQDVHKGYLVSRDIE